MKAMNRMYGLREWETFGLRTAMDASDQATAHFSTGAGELLTNLTFQDRFAVDILGNMMSAREGHRLRRDYTGVPAGTSYNFTDQDIVAVALGLTGHPSDVAPYFEGDTLLRDRLPANTRSVFERTEEGVALFGRVHEGTDAVEGLRSMGVAEIEGGYWPKPPARVRAAVNAEEAEAFARAETAALWGLPEDQWAVPSRPGGTPAIQATATYEDSSVRLMELSRAIVDARHSGAPITREMMERLMPSADAGDSFGWYATQVRAVTLRAGIERWVKDNFQSMSEVASVRPEMAEMMVAAGFEPLTLPLPGGDIMFPGLEDYTLPPAVRNALVPLLHKPLVPSDADVMAQMTRGVRSVVGGMQLGVLETVSFAAANIGEQLNNFALAGGLTDNFGATAVESFLTALRIYPQVLLSSSMGIPPRSFAKVLEAGFARGLSAMAEKATPQLSEEGAQALVKLAHEYQVMGTGWGAAAGRELGHIEHATAQAMAQQVAENVGLKLEEGSKLLGLFTNIVFAADDFGRIMTFIARLKMGDSGSAARQAVRRETAEYTNSATIPMDEWFRVFFWFFTYSRQRAGQVFEHVMRHPGKVIAAAEVYRKREELTGFDLERQGLNGARRAWMGAEWMETPWTAPQWQLPWAKVARPGEHLTQGDGQYFLYWRMRMPILEEPSQLRSMATQPVSSIEERGLPFRALKNFEGDTGSGSPLRAYRGIPVLSFYTNLARKTPLQGPEESTLHAVGRRLLRTGLDDEALRKVVERDWAGLQGFTSTMTRDGQATKGKAMGAWYDFRQGVPEQARASKTLIRKYGVEWAMAYELEKMKMFRDLDQYKSRTGISLIAVKMSDLLKNMTTSQLEMSLSSARGKQTRGQATLYDPQVYVDELEKRNAAKPQGPRTWSEQQGAWWVRPTRTLRGLVPRSPQATTP